MLIKIDLWTLSVVKKIKVGEDSRSTAITQDGKYIFAGNYKPGSVLIIDADKLEIKKIINATKNSRIGGLVDAPNNLILFTLHDLGEVWVIDVNRPDFPIIKKFENAGRLLHDASMTPDGRYFVTVSQASNWAWILDTSTLKHVANIPTGKMPVVSTMAIARDLVFITSMAEGNVTVFKIGEWKPLKYIKTAGPGHFIAASPDGRYVWADVFSGPYNDTVQVIDVEKLEIVKNLRPGRASIHPEFSPRGTTVYIGQMC